MTTIRPRELEPLTSLRFFAALMIVLCHIQIFFPWPWAKQMPRFLSSGVSFFFVLSGFILTHVYRSKQVSYPRFVWLRIARLWPVHAAMFLFLVALVPARDLFDTRATAVINLLLLQSYVPFEAYYHSWDSPAWSISTEFFFYLLFPFLLIAIDRTWHWKLGATLVLSFSIALFMARLNLPVSAGLLHVSAIFLWKFPPMRLAEFCLGMGAYVFWSRVVQPMKARALTWTIVECAAVALTVVWLVNLDGLISRMPVYTLRLWIYAAGGAPFFAILIVALADGRGILGRILSRRELVYLGAISFALYLLHYPVMQLMQLPNMGPAPVFAALLFGSVVLHETIEKPARKILTEAPWFRFTSQADQARNKLGDTLLASRSINS